MAKERKPFELPPLTPPRPPSGDWYSDFLRGAVEGVYWPSYSGGRSRARGGRGQGGIATPPIAGPIATPPLVPGSGGTLFDDLLRRPDSRIGTQNPRTPFEELLNKPRSRPPSEFEELLKKKPYRAKVGSLAWALARAGALLGGVLYSPPAGAGSDRRDEPIPETKPGRKGPPRRPSLNPPDFRFPKEPVPALPRTSPGPQVPSAAPETRYTEPRPGPRSVARPAPLPATLPQPRPSPRPTAVPRGTTSPLPSALPFLPLLFPSRQPRPDTMSWIQPGRAIDPANRISRSDRPLTAAQARPVFSPATQSQPFGDCSCPPKGTRTKTRKPRKPREVCYTGTYTERSSGITKLRKRKIPCR